MNTEHVVLLPSCPTTAFSRRPSAAADAGCSPHFATEAYAMRAATIDGTEDIAAACSGTETDIDNEPTSPRGSERRDCGATRPGRQSQPRVGGVHVVPRDSGPANRPRGGPVTEVEPARASVGACVPGTRLDDRINPGVEQATGADGGSHALAAATHWQRWAERTDHEVTDAAPADEMAVSLKALRDTGASRALENSWICRMYEQLANGLRGGV
jgi:hypothetical protein